MLVLWFAFELLHLSHCFLLLQLLKGQVSGHPQLVVPPQPVVAKINDDIILPCRLEPATDASHLLLEWSRPDLTPGFIHVWRNRREFLDFKQPSYEGRTSLSVDGLKLGDLSLKLSKVQPSDNGTYRCLVPQLGKAAFVHLTVVKLQLIGPPQPVVGILGESVTLPCHLEPATDATDTTVEWSRSDLNPNPRPVHLRRDGVDLENETHPLYKGRTSLMVGGVQHGDISLHLSRVAFSDEGRYRCFCPALGQDSFVELTVAGFPHSTHWSTWFSKLALVFGLISVSLGLVFVVYPSPLHRSYQEQTVDEIQEGNGNQPRNC